MMTKTKTKYIDNFVNTKTKLKCVRQLPFFTDENYMETEIEKKP